MNDGYILIARGWLQYLQRDSQTENHWGQRTHGMQCRECTHIIRCFLFAQQSRGTITFTLNVMRLEENETGAMETSRQCPIRFDSNSRLN